MRKSGLLGLLMIVFINAYSQTDTLFTRNQKKIPCKITEIGETEVKYKLPDNLDGPVYVMGIDKIYKYTLSTGLSVMVRPDELSVEGQHTAFMNRRSVIKVHPFSFVNNQFSFAYEQVIKMGTNLDVEVGYINNSISPSTSNAQFSTSSGGKAFMSGFYMKPGVKFMVGQDYSLKGMKYAHPLKGRFIRLDVVFSLLNYQDASYVTSQNTTSGSYPSYGYTTTVNSSVSDITSIAYGGMINYGRQFILGNVLTMEYYFGVGITGQSNSYNNTSATTQVYTQSYYPYYGNSDANNINNYHGFYRWPQVGLSGTFGFRIGFILPEKKLPPQEH